MAQVNLDTASRLDIICRKGDTFSLGIDFGITDLPVEDSATNNNWKMEVRTSAEDTGTPHFADFSFTLGNGDEVGSKLTISAPATSTDDLTPGTYVYDLQHTSGTSTAAVVKTYLYGKFTINDDITI